MAKVIGHLLPEHASIFGTIDDYYEDIQGEVYEAVGQKLAESYERSDPVRMQWAGACLLLLDDGRLLGFPYVVAGVDSIQIV